MVDWLSAVSKVRKLPVISSGEKGSAFFPLQLHHALEFGAFRRREAQTLHDERIARQGELECRCGRDHQGRFFQRGQDVEPLRSAPDRPALGLRSQKIGAGRGSFHSRQDRICGCALPLRTTTLMVRLVSALWPML